MDNDTCKYHPSTPARWHCSHCDVDLCPSCIKTEFLPDEVAVCPLCNNTLLSLGAGNLIPPFWSRIPQFFLYPINLSSLSFIGILSFLSVMLFKPTLLGALMQFVLFAIFLKYAYTVLSRTASGHFTPPKIDAVMVNESLELPLKQLAVFIFVSVTAGTISELFSPFLAFVYVVLMLLCIPATIMIIAIEQSFLKAINPVILVSIVHRIGLPYIVLCAFLLMLLGGADIVMGGVSASTSFSLFLLLYNIFSWYFMIIMFHMIGYVIYQYHEELGYEIDVEYEIDNGSAGSLTEPNNPLLSEASILIKEGNLDGAINVLRESISQNPDDAEPLDQLHKLAKLKSERGLMLDNGPKLINQLIASNKTKRAAEVYLDLAEIKSDFKPDMAAHIYTLAEQLNMLGKYKEALSVMNGFAKHHPAHSDIPRLYFLGAKILCERFKQDSKARSILQDLLKKYPSHELAPNIQLYLETIHNLTS